MTFLIDTHALLWWLHGAADLSDVSRNTIKDKSATGVVSAVVPWEIAIKTRKNLLEAGDLLALWNEKLDLEGFRELPITSEHAIRAGLLPLRHRDPFDRLLIAQAQATGWPVISADRVFDVYGVRRIW